MRQAGVLAAAGLIALSRHVDRLAEDHANTQLLAEGLSQIDEIAFDPAFVQTNMVFISLNKGSAEELAAYLHQHGILILPRHPIRLVTHLDVTAEDMVTVIETVKEFFLKNS